MVSDHSINVNHKMKFDFNEQPNHRNLAFFKQNTHWFLHIMDLFHRCIIEHATSINLRQTPSDVTHIAQVNIVVLREWFNRERDLRTR